MLIFYAMDGCGHCVRAKGELADMISSSQIIVKGPSEAPPGVRGFPHFVNTVNGKSVSGYRPKVELLKALGVLSEGYNREYSGVRAGNSYGSSYMNAEFFQHAPVTSTTGYRTLENYNAPVSTTSSRDTPYGLGGCRYAR